MKKKLLIWGLIAIVILAVASMIYASYTLNKKEKNEDNHLIELTFDELEEKINNKDSFILLLSQTTCTHCLEYKPILKKVLAEYDIVAYEIEIDKLTQTEKAKLKDIANAEGTPNTIFIENGEETNTANRIKGTATESKIKSRLKALGYIQE